MALALMHGPRRFGVRGNAVFCGIAVIVMIGSARRVAGDEESEACPDHRYQLNYFLETLMMGKDG
jgi:hypothetical protein